MQELHAKIDKLDFSQQKAKMARSDFDDWSPDKLDIIERQYRNMLFLWAKYQDKDLPPSRDVDEFWHRHILDTRKYHEDCQLVFGHYLHHFPYFGVRGEQDTENLQIAFAETLRLYQIEFGEELCDIEETVEEILEDVHA